MHLKVLRELGDGVIMRLCSCHLRDDKLGRVADTLEGRSAIENGLDLLAEGMGWQKLHGDQQKQVEGPVSGPK